LDVGHKVFTIDSTKAKPILVLELLQKCDGKATNAAFLGITIYLGLFIGLN
jgi:hypothetical protein